MRHLRNFQATEYQAFGARITGIVWTVTSAGLIGNCCQGNPRPIIARVGYCATSFAPHVVKIEVLYLIHLSSLSWVLLYVLPILVKRNSRGKDRLFLRQGNPIFDFFVGLYEGGGIKQVKPVSFYFTEPWRQKFCFTITTLLRVTRVNKLVVSNLFQFSPILNHPCTFWFTLSSLVSLFSYDLSNILSFAWIWRFLENFCWGTGKVPSEIPDCYYPITEKHEHSRIYWSYPKVATRSATLRRRFRFQSGAGERNSPSTGTCSAENNFGITPSRLTLLPYS